jgi:hypothetical protein
MNVFGNLDVVATTVEERRFSAALRVQRRGL